MLGVDSEFKGNIRFRGTLRIDGFVEGGITSQEGSGSVLIISRKAQVIGNIVSDSVLLSGKIIGNVTAVERVEIFRSGTLKGDIHTGDVMIEGGAEFEGTCRMLDKPDPAHREETQALGKAGEAGRKPSKAEAKEEADIQPGASPA